MDKRKKFEAKSLSLWLVIGFLGVIAISGIALAFSGSANIVIEDCNDCMFGGSSVDGLGEAMFGASGTRFPNGVSADSTSPSAGQLRGTNLRVTNAGIFEGDLNGQKSATTTDGGDFTIADFQSNHIVFLKGIGATSTLPTVAEGLVVKFVTSSAIGTTDWVIASAEGDNIDGTLIVNDTPLACAGEDKIAVAFVAETVSDYVELTGSLLNGTLTWIITGSNFDAASSVTCTDDA